jgi:hypothetical protein
MTYENLRWSRFKNFAAPEMSPIVDENVFPFLRALNGQDGAYAKRMRDARFPDPQPHLLAKVVDSSTSWRGPIGMPRRSLRIHAREDRNGWPEQPVPHAAPHRA